MMGESAPRREQHVARKNYRCEANACTLKIAKGDPYTQISYPPHQPPFERSASWTIRRCCTSCVPIPASELKAPLRCSHADAENQCVLTSGHYPLTQHEYSIGLF